MVAVAFLGAALLLGGCSSPSAVKALDRPAEPRDTLPAGAILPAAASPASVRLLAEKDGVKYFGARDDADTTLCLVVAPSGSPIGNYGGCAEYRHSAGEVMTMSNADATSAMLVMDGFDTSKLEAQRWTKVHDNVLVKRP